MQRANPLSPVKSADERSEESATCPSGMKWREGVILTGEPILRVGKARVILYTSKIHNSIYF